jgi:hypothetical protein
MKFSLPLQLLTVASVALSSIIPASLARSAASFNEQLMDATQVTAIARPYGQNKYDLLVIEQMPGKQQCWKESGANPTLVEPLLLNFDFTGHCRRATDSNGYSVRIDGRDYGLDYLLSVVPSNGELLLVATPRTGGNQKMIVARTKGMSKGFLKFVLEPGWQFSKRTFQNKELGHFYFSGNGETILASGGTLPPKHTPGEPAIAFRDIGEDIYKKEIEQAVALKFIAGFKEDSTFRPEMALTREQLVSMVLEALKTIPEAKVSVPAQIAEKPYGDVESSRWSAAKIQWAKKNNIVSGYPDGSFQPTKEVTRAELVAVLQKASVYARNQRQQATNTSAKQTPKPFSDTSGHWAESIVSQMSAFCQVASPLNETGSAFAPNQPAFRNYAAAATLRMLTCVKSGSQQQANNPTTTSK